jgi:pimeloyl-ACP methyl ester carboxylesterase
MDSATNPAPIATLLENHRAFLRYLERRVGDRALAEDILQDAFAKVVTNPEKAPDHEGIVPWSVVPRLSSAGSFRALLTVTVRNRVAWYRQFEWAEKSGHDLALEEHDIFNVSKLQGGYARYLTAWKGLTPGIGAAVSTGIVPRSLELTYGGRFNPGFSIYLALRPAAHRM